MSKEKVDAYREAKKNRTENIKKEQRAKKLDKIFWRVVLGVIVAGVVVALVITLINVFKNTDDYSGLISTEKIITDLVDIEGTKETEEETEETEAETESESETEEATTTVAGSTDEVVEEEAAEEVADDSEATVGTTADPANDTTAATEE